LRHGLKWLSEILHGTKGSTLWAPRQSYQSKPLSLILLLHSISQQLTLELMIIPSLNGSQRSSTKCSMNHAWLPRLATSKLLQDAKLGMQMELVSISILSPYGDALRETRAPLFLQTKPVSERTGFSMKPAKYGMTLNAIFTPGLTHGQPMKMKNGQKTMVKHLSSLIQRDRSLRSVLSMSWHHQDWMYMMDRLTG
jgi:hypothetical protein